MTMKDMDLRFENAGFKVTRDYKDGTYRFAISRNELITVGRFDYIAENTQSERNERQVRFIDDLISAHETGERRRDIHNGPSVPPTPPKIKKVHFSGPVTTVIWEDGTKSQVRCQDGDDFDPEKSLALAIAKRVLGNKGSWYDEIKKWVEPYCKKELEDAYEFFKLLGIKSPSLQFRFGNCELDVSVKNHSMKHVGPQDSNEAKKEETPNTTTNTTPQKTHYNPIQEAYNIAVKIRDGEDHNIEAIIGFLGEALDD